MPPVKSPLLGRLAVHHKLVTPDQLEEALREQGERAGATNLGEILIERGHLTQKQLAALVKAQQELLARERVRRAAELGAAAGAGPEPAAGEPAAGEPVAGEPVAAEPVPCEPVACEAVARSALAAPAEPSRGRVEPPPSSAARATPPASSATATGDAEALHALLRDAVQRGASDVHVHAGAPLRLRMHGALEALPGAALDAAAAERLCLAALGPDERAALAEHGEVDLCFALPGVGRFRTNVYRQQRGLDAVFHCIPLEPPSLEELGLPAALARFTTYHQGLVLVTGPAGCGKSSTLAALVNLVNEDRREHVITIEDPVEFIHPSKRCIVNQRSVKLHTGSFARALRAAMREDPDVIVIGELRDLETIALALTAAETGHCVLATLHTDSAIRTVNRLIGVFPSDQQAQVRTMLSESLRAVISQRLVPTADGKGRVPALETLVANRAVGNLIRENKTFQLHSILQTGASQGMRLLDHALRELVQSGAVTREAALRHCEDPKALGG
jgi:twitching motility protein PilT